ncbi:MAG: ribosome biogenesis GTPase Der [Chitinivibrionales bacterium]|nr:ribosome biogenesis GTPase Der [Chitinivibrionales bacterium]
MRYLICRRGNFAFNHWIQNAALRFLTVGGTFARQYSPGRRGTRWLRAIPFILRFMCLCLRCRSARTSAIDWGVSPFHDRILYSMNTAPVVSIIGRPNVGKSCLFNRITGRKLAVVDDFEGITRDRNYSPASWNGVGFVVADTGGLIPTSREAIPSAINRQVDIAIEESDLVVFLVEAGTGPTDLDEMIARRLRKRAGDKVLCVVNKAESTQAADDLHLFFTLGLGDPMPVSALHGSGTADMLDTIAARLGSKDTRGAAGHGRAGDGVRIAILGRPNAGKSSLVNKVLRQDRMIVDSVAGTTRDAIDSTLEYNGNRVVLVDTAGLRRKSQVRNNVEYYSNLRALGSIQRSDICVLLIDAVSGLGEQDLKILERVLEFNKGIICAWNKWDRVEKDSKTFDRMCANARHGCIELRNVPMISISALTGLRVTAILDEALAVQERMQHKVPSKEFNEKVHAWVRAKPHPVTGGKEIRILAGKQRAATYPMFYFYTSNHLKVVSSYKRYLVNKIYENYDFAGCPVRISFRPPGRSMRR